MSVPSAAITTLFVPLAEETVPATTDTPPPGRPFAATVPVRPTNGVAGEVVAPPVTTACVLLTRLPYASPTAAGLTTIENACEPKQRLTVSVPLTVKLNVPVEVGVPLIVPAAARDMPGGNAPALTAKL